MRTLHPAPQTSLFTSIAELARSVINAPAGPDGVPCVHACIERSGGQSALVARTCDESQATRLLLSENDPQRLEAALAYLVDRLTAIGLVVVDREALMEEVA